MARRKHYRRNREKSLQSILQNSSMENMLMSENTKIDIQENLDPSAKDIPCCEEQNIAAIKLNENPAQSVLLKQNNTGKIIISENTNIKKQDNLDPSAMDFSCREENSDKFKLDEFCAQSVLLEQKEITDTSHSHNRSPESVLFESQPGEIICCEELSPKLVPRISKIRLNLDIPENDSGSEERDESEKTNSLTEKTSLDYNCLENEKSDKICKDYALEKTISMEKAFGTNFEKIELSAGREISNCTDTVSHCGFTNSDIVLPSHNLVNEDPKDCILNDRRAFSVVQYSGSVDFPEVFSCSTGLEPALSKILSKNESSSNGSIGKIFNDSKACNYFDISLSAEPETNSLACKNENPGNGLDSELPWISEIHWYTQTGKEIFPNAQQMELLKIHGVPEAKKSRKQRTCEKAQNRVENEAKEYFRTRTGSPPAKRCRTTLKFDDVEQTNLLFPPVEVHKPPAHVTKVQVDECLDENAKIDWDTAPESPVSVELPIVSDSDFKTMETESHVTIHPNTTNESDVYSRSRKSLMSRVREIKIPTTRISAFCEWLAKKIIILMKRSYRTGRRSFMSVLTPAPRSSLLAEEELTQVISLIRSENERMLSVLSEKVTYLSNELAQVRVTSETALTALTSEMSGMRGVNNKLADKNDLLAKELKCLADVLEKSQSIPNTKSAPIFTPPAPPPPPPPPPPPLPPALPSSLPITPTTPNSSRSRSIRTPTRKCSTPLLGGRPSITVEDLLKVTLKKAPQNKKENKRNTVPGPRGPVVSLDMLRSVKLKSARRRSSDYNVRSPRRAHSLKNRAAPSLSLSPIMAGADSPLGRILRQVDGYPRRGSKRALSSPTHSENDLTRESPRKFDAVRHSKSHSVIA